MTKIYLDLDGVLADFIYGALCAHAPMEFPGPTRVDDVSAIKAAIEASPGEHPFRQLENYLGVTIQEFWEVLVRKGEPFWSGLREFGWTQMVWQTLNANADVTILTSAPMGKAASSAAAGKYKWVYDHLGVDAPYKTIICPAPLKSQLARGNILIDDLPSNCEAWTENGGYAIQFPSLQWDGVHPGPQEVKAVVAEAIERVRMMDTI